MPEQFSFLSSPLAQWSVLPSFLVGEVTFILLALVALWHARSAGRAHLFLWLGALLAGTANDLIFMALPLVDNFWHAQATVMLTPRLPLYIPCVYISFLYYPSVAARRLGLRPLAQAALTGLVAVLFYAPFDITGAEHLWWTWHDTDLPVATRVLGAPVSSTLWVLTFAGSFAWLSERILRRAPELSWRAFAIGLALVAPLPTVIMVLQITALQQLDGGAPGTFALAAGLAAYGPVAILLGRRDAHLPDPPARHDRVALGAIIAYLAALALITAVFDPATHRSTGVHQEVGECYVEARDVTGLTRFQYLCPTDFDEPFDFGCVDAPPPDGSTWYTVCGRPHRDFAAWMTGVATLAGLGALVFAFLFGALRRRARDA